MRQRYDFTADIGKIDYTRILNSSTILEFSTGFFNSTEDGPPEDDTALARHSARDLSAAGRLAAVRGAAQPARPDSEGACSATSRAPSGHRATTAAPAWVTYDGRWPIYGNDIAINAAINLTHTRGRHTYKMGVMREDELFGQARSGHVRRRVQLRGRQPRIRTGRGYAYANACSARSRSYTESLGRVPDDRRQKTWAWFVQDTWKIDAEADVGHRPPHVQVGTDLCAGRRSVGVQPRALRSDMGRQSAGVLSSRCSTARRASARNPQNGPDPAGDVHRLDRAGHRVHLRRCITARDAVHDQRHRDAARWQLPRYGDDGFIEPLPIQFDPRFGMAWALNPQTVIRVAGGSFHDGTGGATLQQGDGNAAYRLTRTIFFTDFDSYLTGGARRRLRCRIRADRSGPTTERPNNIRFTAAIQREIGKNIVVDVAYVGIEDASTSAASIEHQRDSVRAPVRSGVPRPDGHADSGHNPGALPDAYPASDSRLQRYRYRKTTGWQNYDSLQMQLTRRFTGRFEMAGSYTWARGYEDEH